MIWLTEPKAVAAARLSCVAGAADYQRGRVRATPTRLRQQHKEAEPQQLYQWAGGCERGREVCRAAGGTLNDVGLRGVPMAVTGDPRGRWHKF